MPTFPVLDTESLVQEKDKTRLSGAQSFVSDGTALTAMTIKPGALADEIDVLDRLFLDWQFDFNVDVVTGLNDELDFAEGGAPLMATIAEGSYPITQLAVLVAAAMTAVGSQVYTASTSGKGSTLDTIKITAPGVFTIGGLSPLWEALGFAAVAGKLSYTGARIERVTKRITVKVSGDDTDVSTFKDFEIVSESADALWSSDDKLRKHEADILRYLPEGRATFKDVHRRAQTLILAWLDTEGFIDYFADKIGVSNIGDVSDVTEWATFMALRLIFEGVQNAVEDVFEKKAATYQEREDFYRKRSVVKIDLNKDGIADKYTERVDVRDCRVFRR